MLHSGTLFICATPIGNLEDITLRVLKILKEVDFIAAEDTRHSRKLLNHYDVKTPLISYHQHNEKQRAEELITRLKKGEKGALISDAGMPGISDPGKILIKRCLEENINLDVLPGPNAALTALILSGMPADSFIFLGFLPPKKSDRNKVLKKAAFLSYTLVLYEAPHKLARTLQEILETMGNRRAVVTRELTKVHQTVYRATVSELLEEFKATPPKGECCLILEPYRQENEPGDPSAWLADLDKIIKEGKSKMEAMKIVAHKYGISKRDIYKAALDTKRS